MTKFKLQLRRHRQRCPHGVRGALSPRLRQKEYQLGCIREGKRRGDDVEEENDHGCVQEAEGAAVRDLPLRSAPKTSHAVLNDGKIVLIDGKTRSGHGDLSPPAGTRVPCTSCHLFALAGAWARKKRYGKGVYVTWCLLHAWHGLHQIIV